MQIKLTSLFFFFFLFCDWFRALKLTRAICAHDVPNPFNPIKWKINSALKNYQNIQHWHSQISAFQVLCFFNSHACKNQDWTYQVARPLIWKQYGKKYYYFVSLILLYSTLYSVMCVWEKLWVAKCVLQWFLYSIFVEGGCVNYCCSKIEKRRMGWSYHYHPRMRILSGSVQRRSHRGVFTLKMQSVTVNKCMYVYIVIKIIKN